MKKSRCHESVIGAGGNQRRRAIVLPGPVSVAEVGKVFDEEGRCLDPAIEKRIQDVAKNLIDYVHNSICPRVALEEMARRGAG